MLLISLTGSEFIAAQNRWSKMADKSVSEVMTEKISKMYKVHSKYHHLLKKV